MKELNLNKQHTAAFLAAQANPRRAVNSAAIESSWIAKRKVAVFKKLLAFCALMAGSYDAVIKELRLNADIRYNIDNKRLSVVDAKAILSKYLEVR